MMWKGGYLGPLAGIVAALVLGSISALLALMLSGCIYLPAPDPGPGPRPTPPPTVTATPGPAPTPVLGQFTEGRAVFYVQGLDGLPLSKTSDTFFLFGMTWEQQGYDAGAPVMGVEIRGDSPSNMGFVVNVTANKAHDDLVYKQKGEQAAESDYCGVQMNYHHRQPAADGLWTVEWRGDTVRVASPAGGVVQLQVQVPGSLGFGRVIYELPERKVGRYRLWNGFEAWPHGARTALVEFSGSSGELAKCPAPNSV